MRIINYSKLENFEPPVSYLLIYLIFLVIFIIVNWYISFSGSGSSGYKGLNPLVHRETPSWQKPITGFFNKNDDDNNDVLCSKNDNLPGTSKENIEESNKIIETENEICDEEVMKKKPRRRIRVCSDDEDEENKSPVDDEVSDDW